MKKLTNIIVVLIIFLILMFPAVCSAQDRDITEGSSTGSIRSDVSERPIVPRHRMETAESRAKLVAELRLFRGAEKLFPPSDFAALKNAYCRALEKAAQEKPIRKDLNPIHYLVFRIMAEKLSQEKPGINSGELLAAMISSYVRTGDFMQPILDAGFTKDEATTEFQAAAKKLPGHFKPEEKEEKTADVYKVTITYGIAVNDRPRQERAGVPKRKGTLGLIIQVAPRWAVGITNDTFSSKRRSDGSYITGIGNTTPNVKFTALNDQVKHRTISLTYLVTLPTASVAKTLGTGRIDHKIIGDFAKKFLDQCGGHETKLGLSLGYLFAGRKGKPGFSKTGLAVLSLDRTFGAGFTSKNEVDLATRADSTPSEIFAINQIVYDVNKTLSIRAGVRTGITANSPRIGLTAGLTINTSLEKIFK